MSTDRKLLACSFTGKYIMKCDVSIGEVVARGITVAETNPGQGELFIEVPTHSDAGDLIGAQLRNEFSCIAQAVYWGVEEAVGADSDEGARV